MRIEHCFLAVFRVAREQHRGRTVVDAQTNRALVRIRLSRFAIGWPFWWYHRPDFEWLSDCYRRRRVLGVHNGGLNASFVCRVVRALYLGLVGIASIVDIQLNVEVLENVGRSANMIGMLMRNPDERQWSSSEIRL